MTKKLGQKPHDIPRMFELIREAVRSYPPAMLFELAARGFNSPFEQLMACILSIRTRDETSLKVAEKLLMKARTPQELLKISDEDLLEVVKPSTFPGQKVSSLKRISQILLKDHQGLAPCTFEELTSLPGVGPKCANLVLGIACGVPRIGVDVHVHRVTNRWGYISASTPEKSMVALEDKLPQKYWVEINELLVPFGKHICLGSVPKCSRCPVLAFCSRVGVHRSQ